MKILIHSTNPSIIQTMKSLVQKAGLEKMTSRLLDFHGELVQFEIQLVLFFGMMYFFMNVRKLEKKLQFLLWTLKVFSIMKQLH